jgi:hypothetical protein
MQVHRVVSPSCTIAAAHKVASSKVIALSTGFICFLLLILIQSLPNSCRLYLTKTILFDSLYSPATMR